MMTHTFVDGYCSTLQGLLDWFEVDLGFTELSFMHNYAYLSERCSIHVCVCGQVSRTSVRNHA